VSKNRFLETMTMDEWQQRIVKPTLLLDQNRAVNNIQKMAARAQEAGIRFRPHFKTHQSAAVGEWFREQGVTAITVSSVDMAVYFAAHGWEDITIAFPVNVRQLSTIEALGRKIQLNVVVESVETVARMEPVLETDLNVWLKIDTGLHRTGLAWDDRDGILAVAKAVAEAPNLTLTGLLTHAGHTYAAGGTGEIARIYQETEARLNELRQALGDAGWPVAVSVGDTPACRLVSDLGSVDEIRPGNFVFYDLMQWRIGSCLEEEIALAVACPVVAKHPTRQQLVIYGGAVHLSKEAIRDQSGQLVYGRLARLTEQGWSAMLPGATVVSLSQEHGIIQAEPWLVEEIGVGDIVAVIPVHSCLTANLFGWYLTTRGEVLEMARFFFPY
jgi:D-serine deaminase-like pyridoxal phosphate-dependent protein